MKRAWLVVFGLLACALAVGCSSKVNVTSTGSGGGGSADAGVDASQGGSGADGGTPSSTIFRLSFISDVPESIWANETDSAWLSNGHWLTILRGGAAIRKGHACEQCSCDQCPNCPVCGAPCPTATEIAAGGALDWSWSGYEYPSSTCPSSPQDSCLAETAAAAGSYVARFCWGSSYTGTPPCPAEVTNVQCAEVPFQHPDPDGLVEYLVNNGG